MGGQGENQFWGGGQIRWFRCRHIIWPYLLRLGLCQVGSWIEKSLIFRFPHPSNIRKSGIWFIASPAPWTQSILTSPLFYCVLKQDTNFLFSGILLHRFTQVRVSPIWVLFWCLVCNGEALAGCWNLTLLRPIQTIRAKLPGTLTCFTQKCKSLAFCCSMCGQGDKIGRMSKEARWFGIKILSSSVRFVLSNK